MDRGFFCPGKRGATGSIASVSSSRSRISREGQSLLLALTEASVSCYRRALQLRTLCAIFSTSVQWPQVNFLRIRIPSISFQILENNSKERNEYF